MSEESKDVGVSHGSAATEKRGPEPETAEEPAGWSALLSQLAHAPNVQPVPFLKLIDTKGLVGQCLGHFRILELLGEGGMGVVYKARDEHLDRLVALKVVRPQHVRGRGQQQLLLREARSAAAVSHPNIASIYEVGEADGIAYIAMEYIDGKSLRSLISERSLSEEEALKWSIEIAGGMARAHNAGIVHRDLKPENVLIDKDGRAKILDFGLARPFQPTPEERDVSNRPTDENGALLKQSSQVLGTPPYMSPEQTEGADVDARSDIYSFGVLLHELLTQEVPSTPPRTTTTILGRKPSSRFFTAFRESDATPRIRSEIKQIIRRCLHVNRQRRFANGAELLQALLEVSKDRRDAIARSPVPRVVAFVLTLTAMVFAVVLFVRRNVTPYNKIDHRPIPEHRLTANPPETLISDSALSPDGTKLAFVDNSGLWIRHLQPLRTEPVTFPSNAQARKAFWSADSRNLLISMTIEDTNSIWRLDEHGVVKQLAPIPSSVKPYISPDGSAYAWVDGAGLHWKSFAEEADHLLVASKANEFLTYPTWSPTGKQLAYVRARQFNQEPQPVIETVDLSGGHRRELIDDAHLLQDDGGPTLGWAPDGRLIYGLAEWPPRESGTTLWTIHVDPDSGEVRGASSRIASWTSSISGRLTVSRQGALSFQKYTAQFDVYVADFDEREARLNGQRRLTLTEHDEWPTAWTADSGSVVFMSNENAGQNVFVQSLLSAKPQILTSGSSWHTWPRFTRDGLLLFWQIPSIEDTERRPELMAIRLPSGTPTKILTAGIPAPPPLYRRPPPRNTQFRCPLKARSCLLGEVENNQLRLSSFDPEKGLERDITRIALMNTPWFVDWDVSPDGSQMVLPLKNGRLRLVDLSTQSEKEISVNERCNLQSASWTASGNGIFTSGVCAPMYKLFFVELSGPIHPLYESSYEWIGHPVASPDGKHVAFALKPGRVDVWMLDSF